MVECGRLEICCTVIRTGGSNPSLSANSHKAVAPRDAGSSHGPMTARIRAMPIYEYACRACRHEFETLVRGADTPSCVSCGSADLEKKLSVFAAQKADAAAAMAAGACGTCGNPNGPGSCALN